MKAINIIGLADTKFFLLGKSAKVIKLAEKGIAQAGEYVAGEVKQSISGYRDEPTSVDTGRFKGSVKSDAKGLTATISSNVNYAVYLEEGTSRIKPRLHFKNTADRNQKKVKDFIENEIKKL